MRARVNIDAELLRKAVEASGLPTREAVVEEGLRMIIALSERAKLDDAFDLLPLGIKHPSRH
jgi:hypothetical protein